MEKSFDFNSHRLTEPRYFEDFVMGEKFCIPSRTQTDAIFAAFALASGDNHPIHYDIEYCKKRGHKGLVAHGMQILCQTAAGAGLFADMVGDSLVGMIELGGNLKKFVYSGDTIYPQLMVNELSENKSTGVVGLLATVHNQNGELVFEGIHKYVIRKRNPVTK